MKKLYIAVLVMVQGATYASVVVKSVDQCRQAVSGTKFFEKVSFLEETAGKEMPLNKLDESLQVAWFAQRAYEHVFLKDSSASLRSLSEDEQNGIVSTAVQAAQAVFAASGEERSLSVLLKVRPEFTKGNLLDFAQAGAAAWIRNFSAR